MRATMGRVGVVGNGRTGLPAPRLARCSLLLPSSVHFDAVGNAKDKDTGVLCARKSHNHGPA